MISVICCSNKKELSIRLKTNIEETIGIEEWEWLGIDNYNTGKGICQVYNQAAAFAKGEILCFVHEDIIFHTENWGSIIEKIINQIPSTGVIGVAGSTLISGTPAGWYNFHLRDENRYNILQQSDKENCNARMLKVNPQNEKLSQVLVVDGVLMFTKKTTWERFRFDQENFREFHFYDLDYSARVAEQYKNFVTYDILIEHCSSGILNRNWVENVLTFKNKFKGRLPISLSGIPVAELAEEESQKIRHLLNNMVRFRVKPSLQFEYLFQHIKYDFPGSVKLGLKILVNLFNVNILHGHRK